jgi:hypothetical protein
VIEGESARHDVMELEHGRLPDPVARAMNAMIEKLNELAVRIRELEERQDCLEQVTGAGPPSQPRLAEKPR